MRCFLCAKEIVIPPPGDPLWDFEDEDFHYFPASILEVLKGDNPCRCTVMCFACFHVVDPDMWIDERTWNHHNPAIPYDKLPLYDHEAKDNNWLIETYKDYAPTADKAE